MYVIFLISNTWAAISSLLDLDGFINKNKEINYMKRLEGKIAVITAAGAGIGRCTAQRFSEEGACVWATDIDEAALASLKEAYPSINTS